MFNTNTASPQQVFIRRIKRIPYYLSSWIVNFPGLLVAIKAKLDKKAIIFSDQYGFKYWLDPNQDRIYLNWKRKAVLDSVGVINFIFKYIQPNQICVDIGAANAGVSVPLWSKVGAAGKVISIEADPTKINKIKKNLLLNNYPDTYVVNKAISSINEVRKFRCFPDSPGWNTFGDPPVAQIFKSFCIDVECINLETLLNSYELKYVDFVKIDTEGAELLILEGMTNALQNQQIGCVIFEVNPMMLPGMNTTLEQLFSFWDNLPYDLHKLTDDGNIELLTEPWPENEIGDCVAMLKQTAIAT